MEKKIRVAFHNLGCKVNSYETEAMLAALKEYGCEEVPFEEQADVYVVNTCTVTNIADRKSRQMLHRAKALNPHAAVVAVGCYAQAAGEKLLQDEAVDILIGNDRKRDLPELLSAWFESREKQSALDDIGKSRSFEEMPADCSEHTRAFLKIEDGCNQFCSYCIIPYARGRVRSRSIADVRTEIEQLASNGYQEVVLTGIHLSSYGVDLDGEDLLSLIRMVNEIDGIKPFPAGYLTLALGGAYLGSCFVQKEAFYTSQNVVVLIPKDNINYETKQFIATAIFRESQNNYKAFIKELNRHIKRDFVIKLPVDEKGNPDYEYMSEFMKKIQLKVD